MSVRLKAGGRYGNRAFAASVAVAADNAAASAHSVEKRRAWECRLQTR